MITGPLADATHKDLESSRGYTKNLAIGVTVAILGVMAIAIAIDFSSVPTLAMLTIVLIGGLIAALIAWG